MKIDFEIVETGWRGSGAREERGKKRLPIQKLKIDNLKFLLGEGASKDREWAPNPIMGGEIDTNPKLSNLKWVTLTGKGLSRKLRGEAGDASERSSTNPQTQPIRKCTAIAIEGLLVVGRKVEKL